MTCVDEASPNLLCHHQTVHSEIRETKDLALRPRSQTKSVAAHWMLRSIRWYQLRISSQTAPRCKYYPTCSSYALEAIDRFGALRGLMLASFRLLRCRPWSNGGIDDVPQHFSLLYRCSWSKAHEEPRLTATASDKEIA